MKKKYLNELIISMYKLVMYSILLATFILTMKQLNIGITVISRTSIITSLTFVVVIMLMMPVYGNFEIGFRKSKPVFNATMISVFMADIISFFVFKLILQTIIVFFKSDSTEGYLREVDGSE